MQKKYVMFLFIVVPAIILTSNQANAMTISFVVSDPYIEAGETFTVDVFAQDDITAGDLWLFGFDVASVSSLSLISYDGYSVDSNLWIDKGYNSDNSLPYNYVAAFWLNLMASNAGENLHLATLFFTAGGTVGVETLSIEGLLSDGDYGAYYYNSFVDISGETQATIAPEPQSLVLFSLGMVGLSALVRRKLYF